MSPVFFLSGLVTTVVDYMGDYWKELAEHKSEIRDIVDREATRFMQIYESGKELLESELSRLGGGNFPGAVAFTLHDTYGFPIEVTREVLAERGVSLDEAGYEAAMDAQRTAPGRPRRATTGPSRPSGARRSGAGSSATSARG
jgi:alanyl-tRNA synthetase